MAVIDSSGYSILNARTVVNILKSAAVQNNKNYPHIRSRYFNIKKETNTRILIIVNPQYSSNIERIFDDLARLFSVDVLIKKRKVFTSSKTSDIVGINFILNLQQNVNIVKIFFKTSKVSLKEKMPELLRPGVLNEEYFTSVINDAVSSINDAKRQVNMPKIFDPKLLLGIYENNKKKSIIGPIKSIERVGQELGKADVIISTKEGNVNISLKKENFSFWSSASGYTPAKKILDYLIKTNQIKISRNNVGRNEIEIVSSGKKVEGIKLPATIGEIKKYCFGEKENRIDYILINSYNPGDFKEVRKIGKSGEDYKLDLNSKIVYTEKTTDIIRMKDDVYLTIVTSSSNSSGLMPEYPGFRIHFANKKSSSNLFYPDINGESFKRI
jgi:hypothetical protein